MGAILLKEEERYSVFEDESIGGGKWVEWNPGTESPTLAEIQEVAAKEFPNAPADQLDIHFFQSTLNPHCDSCRCGTDVIFLSAK